MGAAATRVAILLTATEFGGAERVVLSLLDRVDPKKHELVPIIYTRKEYLAAPFFEPFRRRQPHIVHANDFRVKYLNPLVNAMQTARLVRNTGCQLIHAHGYRAHVLGMAAATYLGLPFLATCHGYISTGRALSVYNAIDRYVLRLADGVIAVSREIRDDLLRSGVKGTSITVIPNAVDVAVPGKGRPGARAAVRRSCGCGDDDVVVGFLGRLSEEKGVRYLLEALQLSSGRVRMKLVVAGDGPQRGMLEQAAEALGVHARVHFAGFQPDVGEWLDSLDVFVLPSLTEGTPMALLEAMAHGLPVVATRVGGVPDIVDSGRNGLLVAPGNPSELKEALVLLSGDRGLRDAMADAAKRTVSERYGIGEWARKHEELYGLLVSGEKRVA